MSVVSAVLEYKWYPIQHCCLPPSILVLCNNETFDICTQVMISWEVKSADSKSVVLNNCEDAAKIQRGDEMLFIATRGNLINHVKYEIMKVDNITGCHLTLTGAFTQPVKSSDSYTIAQLFPAYKNVTLRNKCVLTCRMQDRGHGGILALRAKMLNIDGTSVISTTGLGRPQIILNSTLLYTPRFLARQKLKKN